MTPELKDIHKSLSYVNNNTTVLDMLIEIERTLDNCDIYAYQNWDKGELVSGPDIDRYWITTVWMYKYDDMPDPDGGLRLTKIGCKVNFKKDIFKHPIDVTGPESYINPTTKQVKLKKEKIWLVTITMPRKFIDEGLVDDFEELAKEDLNSGDIVDAYDSNVDPNMNNSGV